MTKVKKETNRAPNPDSEEETDLLEADDMNQFIRKIQLQSQVLKKLSDNLEKQVGKEKDNLKGGN